ncbi:hypothetical protein STENM223S_07049 [Streptomyces tendae]
MAGSASGGVKLVVNPKKIKTLDDLKGKRIATPQIGNTQDVAFLNWISEKGWKVDPQSGKGDVSVVRSDNKVTPDAYKSGSLDGAWVPEPTAFQAGLRGREGASRRDGPVAGQEVRDHAHHRVLQRPLGAGRPGVPGRGGRTGRGHAACR